MSLERPLQHGQPHVSQDIPEGQQEMLTDTSTGPDHRPNTADDRRLFSLDTRNGHSRQHHRIERPV